MTTRTVRADNFALSEDTKRQRDEEQSQICDFAYAEAVRLLEEHRDALERLASKLLERETLDREDVATMLHDVQRVGTLAFSWPDGPTGPARSPSRLAAAGGSAVAAVLAALATTSSSSSPPAAVISSFLASMGGLRVADARRERAEVAAHRERAGLPAARTPPRRTRRCASSISPSSLRSWSFSCCVCASSLALLEGTRSSSP